MSDSDMSETSNLISSVWYTLGQTLTTIISLFALLAIISTVVTIVYKRGHQMLSGEISQDTSYRTKMRSYGEFSPEDEQRFYDLIERHNESEIELEIFDESGNPRFTRDDPRAVWYPLSGWTIPQRDK